MRCITTDISIVGRNFINDFREIGEDWTALPEFFLKHGFYTTGAGKIYHPGKPANFDENRSWSGQKWPGQFSKCDCGGHGWPPQGQASCEGLPPHACQEDNIVEVVVGQLEQAANGTLGDGKQPFFIAAGFHKPHLPFYAPPEYFDLYVSTAIAMHPLIQFMFSCLAEPIPPGTAACSGGHAVRGVALMSQQGARRKL
jgi:hypothetical protein